MDELRKRANEFLKQNPDDNSNLSLMEMKKILEELQVHQIELKIQNEELREKQVEIEKAKTKYFGLFNLAPVGYLIIDEKAIIQEINLKACDIFERRKDHLLFHPFVSMLDSSSMSEFYEYYDRVKKNKVSDYIELTLNRKNEIRYIELTANKYIDNLFLVILTDITERKRVENQNIKLSQAVNQSSNTIVMTDVNGNIEYTNPKFTALTGYTAEEALGQNPKILNAHTQPKEIYSEMWETIVNGNTWKGEFHNKTKSGILFWEHVTISPIKDKAGKVINYLAIKEDVTAKKRAEQSLKENEIQLRELNATKDKFFSIIAHDLRNPFTGIMGLAEIMEMKLTENRKENEPESGYLRYVNLIYMSAKSGFDLLENLMQWASSQTNSISINPKNISMDYILSNTIPIVSGNAFKKKITIESNISNNEIVYADELLLNTVLRNLLNNAIKFTYPDGKITISTQKKNNLLEISVADTGMGIHSTILSKIFRIDSKHTGLGTDKEKGTGLGLILCKEFVEKQGGTIWVESQVDVGTTFTFTLPLVSDK